MYIHVYNTCFLHIVETPIGSSQGSTVWTTMSSQSSQVYEICMYCMINIMNVYTTCTCTCI